jgi:CheY-like chemotaxis protein
MGEIGLNALVVDDNEVNTMILANMLELFGIRVDQIYSGEKAINMFHTKAYDLVFIDHVMPEMNGLQTTEGIRSYIREDKKTAIFILSSHVSERLKSMYRKSGANDVFNKPLELETVILILKQWFPEVLNHKIPYLQETFDTDSNDTNLFKDIQKALPEINYQEGLKYAVGNPKHYAHILKVSVKDIKGSMDRIRVSIDEDNIDGLRIGIHNLKSLFCNIGAISLYEKTKSMYLLIRQGEYDELILKLNGYILEMNDFNERLGFIIKQYETNMPINCQELKQEQSIMTGQEYEQCLSNTIYYIKSYQYNSIIKGLQLLINFGDHAYKNNFKEALENIRNFDYDSALSILMNIKKDR